MANEVKTPIPARLYNAAVGGHVAGTEDIYDDTKGKTQKQINSEVEESLGTGGSVDSRIASAVATETTRAQGAEEQLRQAYEALSQSQPIPVTELPATGEAGKIYRLAGTNSYADYMYAEGALTTPIKMAEYDNAIDDEPAAGSDNLVKSGGVVSYIDDEDVFEYGWHYIGGDGSIIKWSGEYKLSRLFIVDDNITITNAISPNAILPCCVIYDEYFNVLRTIIATTPSTGKDTEFMKTITFSDLAGGKYFRFLINSAPIFNVTEYNVGRLKQLYYVNQPNPTESPLLHKAPYTNGTAEYYKPFFNNYSELNGKIALGVRGRFYGSSDINVLLFDYISLTNQVIMTIPASTIEDGVEKSYMFDKEIELKENQYIGFDKNCYFSVMQPSESLCNGCSIIGSQDTIERQTQVVFNYGIYYKKNPTLVEQKTISFITDSLGDPEDLYAIYPKWNYINRLLDIKNFTLCGKSVMGGTCITPGVRPYNAFTDENRWKSLRSNGLTGDDPDIILIQGGVNDFAAFPNDGSGTDHYCVVGSPSDYGLTPSTSFYAAYYYLLKNIMNEYPNATIVCCTPPKTFEGGFITNDCPVTNKNSIVMTEFVDAVIKVATDCGAKVIDLYRELPDNYKNWRNYHANNSDGFHPNFVGFANIALIIANKI